MDRPLYCSNCTATATATSSSSSTHPELVGWVLETDGRGTLSLLTTCLSTILLCTWVVIHPRVYQHERHATLHKIVLFLKTLLAPEFIAVEGLQEWAQCRRMATDCAAHSNGEFRLIHAYYISMLALRYHTPEGNKVIWPNQYTWLLEQRVISWADRAHWGLTAEQIRDKSKADSVAKLFALYQVSWFVVTCVLRAVRALPLSQLEAMTLGYIPLFAVTYFFWWAKPKDIRSPTVVALPEMSREQMREFESMAVSDQFDCTKSRMTYWNIWYLTPRVFEKEAEDQAVRDALRAGNALEGPSVEELRLAVQKQTVLAHWDPYLYRSKITWSLCCLFGASFGALHLASWNTIFPTDVEMWLWRVSAFISIFSLLIFMHFEKVVFRWNGVLSALSIGSAGLYFLSRILMMGEVFAALRAEDPAVYDTFDFSNYWIHVF